MSVHTKLVGFFLASMITSNAYAIYQCKASNGALTFQDKPCDANQKQEQVTGTSPEKIESQIKSVQVWVPGTGEVITFIPKDWEYSIEQSDRFTPPTLRIKANGKHGRISLIITLFTDSNNVFSDTDSITRAVEEVSKQYVATSTQGRIEVKEIASASSFGSYASFTEKNPPPKSDFSNITSGLFNSVGAVYSFTLLSSDLSSSNYNIAMALVSKGIIAVSHL